MSIVETIDRAIAQYGEHTHPDIATSGDAMRWTPETEGLPQPKASEVGQLYWSGWTNIGYTRDGAAFEPIPDTEDVQRRLLQLMYEFSARQRHGSQWRMTRDTLRLITRHVPPMDSPQCIAGSLFGMPVVVDENIPQGTAVIVPDTPNRLGCIT